MSLTSAGFRAGTEAAPHMLSWHQRLAPRPNTSDRVCAAGIGSHLGQVSSSGLPGHSGLLFCQPGSEYSETLGS
jgi:hypothetical protein